MTQRKRPSSSNVPQCGEGPPCGAGLAPDPGLRAARQTQKEGLTMPARSRLMATTPLTYPGAALRARISL